MNLYSLDARTLMAMLFESIDCYCKCIKQGHYKGEKFDKCRFEMLEICAGLRIAMSGQSTDIRKRSLILADV